MNAGRVPPRPRLCGPGMACRLRASVLALLAFSSAFSAEGNLLDLRAEAEAAYGRRDYAAARSAVTAALAQRPDSPQLLHNLAALDALTGQTDQALGHLRRLAQLGVAPPIERDPDLAALQGSSAFRSLAAEFVILREPLGEAQMLAELPGRTGILEAAAFRERTGDLFLGDARLRCVWRRDREGRVTRFTDEDQELLGVHALAIDEPNRTLWVGLASGPEMEGYLPSSRGRAALVAFSLVNGELLRAIDLPEDGRDHGIGGLVVDPEGTLYATDSRAPVIWKVAPGAEEPEVAASSPAFVRLQGLVLQERHLLVADQEQGLFRVELAGGAMTPLPTPRNSTLVGIGALVRAAGGLVAVQRGVQPPRVLKVELSPALDAVTSVSVLARGLPYLDDLAGATLINGLPTVIAGSGWDLPPAADSKPSRGHTVRLLQVALP